jgi:hypothetical protein
MRLQTQGGDDLASHILKAMEKGRYSIAIGQDVVNIVYVEGMDPTGKANPHLPNTFDSIRALVRVFESEPPKIIGIWEATTEPGRYWTEHPMNPRGAARIAFGQYPAWIVGQYHDQEALIQVKPIIVYRDYFRRAR